MAYGLISAVIIEIFSYLDYEEMIGEGEIKNVCVVLEALVIDDTRDVMAPVTFLFVLPLIYMATKRKFKSAPINIITVLLLTFWLWRFFLRYQFC
ncbi:YjeO family protein [Erwinia iniecta]